MRLKIQSPSLTPPSEVAPQDSPATLVHAYHVLPRDRPGQSIDRGTVHARQAGFQVSRVDVPDVDGSICRACCKIVPVRAENGFGVVTSTLETISSEGPPRVAHPQIHHLQALVSGAAEKLPVIRTDVQ